ncbi:EamA family transporter [Wenxinia marina]|uniref:EamA family transporter n=1 Tax=Wenxinia marina TaxID=390641 RepID=UPI0003748A31
MLLTSAAMVAFAANSVLNRLAVAGLGTDPVAFAILRTVSGALVLTLLVAARGGGGEGGGWRGATALALYMAGFSLAYLTLDAGIGALILFGGVQVTMFAGAVLGREAVPPRRWAGAALALAGLALLVWPAGGAGDVPAGGAALMAAAALGWGVYSLLGWGAADPLAATARNFRLATPLVLAPLLVLPVTLPTPAGAAAAILSGAVTSGLGYALWYRLLPTLGASRAAVAQLSVPVLAAAAGWLLLAEPPGARAVAASALVLGGIALSLWTRPGAGALRSRTGTERPPS